MNWNPQDIERIVREVLRSMVSGAEAAGSVPTPHAASSVSAPAAPTLRPSDGNSPQSVYSIASAVVSVESLRSLPAGTQRLEIGTKALITPAAKDWCRERSLIVSRCSHLDSARAGFKQLGAPEQNPAVTATRALVGANATLGGVVPTSVEPLRPAKLFVSGSVLWLRSLEKQLCPKQTRIAELQHDDAGVIRSVATAVRQGHAAAVAIVESPYSALWQAARDEALRPVLISQWSDLADGLREVPTNVLIVPAKRWNIAGTANIARHFLEHIRSRS